MKVLLINDHIHFGGGGDAVFQLEKRALEERGHKVYTLSFGDKNNCDEFNQVVDSKGSKIEKFIGSRKLTGQIKNYISKISPDVVHIHLISKFPLAIYNTNILKRIPVIQTLHGPNLFCATSWGGLKDSSKCDQGIDLKCYLNRCSPLSHTLIYWQLKMRYWSTISKHIDVFHCPSKQIRTTAKKLGLKNCLYIPLGIDKVFEEEPIRTTLNRPTLLYVGTLAIQKGVQFLIPALKIIKQKIPNVLLRIAGTGPLLNKINEEVRNFNLEKNVEILGFVEHSKIRTLYLSSDVFIMPSIWQEQFGLVGPEALACKTPCIATNVGGIPEWLKDNENGLLISPQSANEIASASIKLLLDNELRLQLGEEGRKFVLTNYSGTNYANKIVKMLENVNNE